MKLSESSGLAASDSLYLTTTSIAPHQGNQFRGIDEEDSAFLAQVQDDSIQQEILKKKQEAQELAAFRASVSRSSLS